MWGSQPVQPVPPTPRLRHIERLPLHVLQKPLLAASSWRWLTGLPSVSGTGKSRSCSGRRSSWLAGQFLHHAVKRLLARRLGAGGAACGTVPCSLPCPAFFRVWATVLGRIPSIPACAWLRGSMDNIQTRFPSASFASLLHSRAHPPRTAARLRSGSSRRIRSARRCGSSAACEHGDYGRSRHREWQVGDEAERRRWRQAAAPRSRQNLLRQFARQRHFRFPCEARILPHLGRLDGVPELRSAGHPVRRVGGQGNFHCAARQARPPNALKRSSASLGRVSPAR